MTRRELNAAPGKSSTCRRCSAPSSVYNIPGVDGELKFTRTVLADIFLGKITKWNDPAHRRTQPGRERCQRRHRGGPPLRRVRARPTSSPTTSPRSRPEWKTKVGAGTSVKWPVGIGGKGNEGVAGVVKQTPGSIGYVELIYALQNKIAVRLGQEQRRDVRAASIEGHGRGRAAAVGCRPTSASRSPTRRERRLPDRVVHLAARLRGPEGQGEGEGDGGVHAVGPGDGQKFAPSWAMRRFPRASSRWPSSRWRRSARITGPRESRAGSFPACPINTPKRT